VKQSIPPHAQPGGERLGGGMGGRVAEFALPPSAREKADDLGAVAAARIRAEPCRHPSSRDLDRIVAGTKEAP
jgi:hypothetical protein